LNPGLFTKQNTELLSEFARLATEKKHISYSVSGNASKVDEAQRLIRFCSRNRMVLEFNDSFFEDFAYEVVVNSREEIVFRLKCGLSLKERLVE
jgi:site-specific DNA recombinase